MEKIDAMLLQDVQSATLSADGTMAIFNAETSTGPLPFALPTAALQNLFILALQTLGQAGQGQHRTPEKKQVLPGGSLACPPTANTWY